MHPLWFFHLYILSSATTALSTLCQGRFYPHTHTHTHIYKYIYIYIYWDREKTERLYFHPYKLVSWLLTHQGIFIKTGFIYASLVSTVYWLAVSRPPNYFCTWYIFNSMRTQLTRFNRIGQSLTWVVNYTIKGISGKLRETISSLIPAKTILWTPGIARSSGIYIVRPVANPFRSSFVTKCSSRDGNYP